MRRGVLVIVGVLLLSSFGAMLFIGEADSLEDGVSFMEMYATDTMELTPMQVNDSTMKINRTDRWSMLPMLPWEWYEIGDWDAPYMDVGNYDMGEIMGPTIIWITLSCPEEITIDLVGTFNLDFNSAVDSYVMEEISIGPDPKTFQYEFDTEGISLEDVNFISMRWRMKGGNEDVTIHLGMENTGMITHVEPLYVISIFSIESLGLYVTFEKPFEAWESWDFDFRITVDDGPFVSVDHIYRISGATEYYHLYDGDFIGEPGEHLFQWEADYGVNSHSSGSYWFTIEEDPPPGDDDEPPVGDDDDEPPVGDDDDEPPVDDDDDEEPIELLSEDQCRRDYSDAKGDDLYYWANERDEVGIERGVMPSIDIKDVSVRRNGDDLVVTVTTFDEFENDPYIRVYILPDDTHIQPSLDLDPQDRSDIPVYIPENYVSTNYMSFSFYPPRPSYSGRTFTLTWSLEILMMYGLTEDFEVYVQSTIMDVEIDGPVSDPDHYLAYIYTDYAGSGAWEVPGEEEEEPIDQDTENNPANLIVPAIIVVVVLVLIVFMVILFISMGRRKKVLD